MASVTVPVCDPFKVTLTPGRAAPSSEEVTRPVTACVWACNAPESASRQTQTKGMILFSNGAGRPPELLLLDVKQFLIECLLMVNSGKKAARISRI